MATPIVTILSDETIQVTVNHRHTSNTLSFLEKATLAENLNRLTREELIKLWECRENLMGGNRQEVVVERSLGNWRKLICNTNYDWASIIG